MSGQSNEGTMGKVLEREFLEFLETKEQIHEWIKVNTCGKMKKQKKVTFWRSIPYSPSSSYPTLFS